MISLVDVHIRQMYAIRKHVIKYYDAIGGSFVRIAEICCF